MQRTSRTSCCSAVSCTPSATDEKNGLRRSGTMSPTAETRRYLRLRALLLGLYASSSMLFSTRSRVASATDSLRLMTALTVPTDTCARAATSLIVFARLIDQHPLIDAVAVYTAGGACGIK